MRLLALMCLLPAMALGEAYTVAPRPHGQVRFKIEGPLDDVTGETKVIAGMVELQSIGATRALVAVDLGTIRTGIDERDRDMRVEFLQTTRFPFALLQVDKIERPSAAELTAGKSAEGEAVGSFEVHGVRRAVRFAVKLALDEAKRLTISGSFDVPFADYGIARPSRLFLKLGEVAQVSFEVGFVPKAEAPPPAVAAADAPVPPVALTVASVQPASAKVKPRPPRKPKPEISTRVLFSGDDAKAKGERLFHSASLGGSNNALTCAHCHSASDERKGFTAQDGYARAASSLFDAGQRPKFWNGFAATVGDAAAICQKMYMRGAGLTADQKLQLQSFVDSISPDPAPELDYRVLYRTYDSSLRDPIGGDPVRGKALADVYCMTCHLDGRVGPTWAPGLYEPEWVVKRVRHLEGHSARQMPPFSIARLPDSELRDIVTFLASPAVAPPVFNRKLAAK